MELSQLIGNSRTLQEDFYSGDKSLRGRLIQGILRNIGDIAPPEWAIDLFREIHTESRDDLMAMVDTFIYAASLLSTVDMDVSELATIVYARQTMVAMMHQSWLGLHDLRLSSKPIAVLDIDGVLFPFPSVFNKFWEEKKRTSPDMPHATAKDLYRRSGLKAVEAPIPGAKDLFDTLVNAGMSVVMLSSRPVSLYPEVYLQTIEFLQKNSMVPDVLAFKSGKHIAKELDRLWPRVSLFVDDEEHHLSNIKSKHPHVHCIHAKNDESVDSMSRLTEEVRRLILPGVVQDKDFI